ncbi:hypothetical protein BaRGS_00007792 [Batillaria attramentaria]|uniref:Uncharacterized protein n=1 Tax=Batillaria attramentaria TaxID=370345 RepID=A0ABD0LMV6_9CAEN
MFPRPTYRETCVYSLALEVMAKCWKIAINVIVGRFSQPAPIFKARPLSERHHRTITSPEAVHIASNAASERFSAVAIGTFTSCRCSLSVTRGSR